MAKKTDTTQGFVPIKEIRNGVIILKDGSLRSLLMVSSINFGLKSNDEKMAILTEYQNFLNSLDFPIQIFVQSRKLDIRPYLATLEQRRVEQTNELLKVQVKEYIEFIRFFTETHNVMTKNFFAVVSYVPPIFQTSGSGILSSALSFFNKKSGSQIALNASFDENVEQLNQRLNVVKGGLARIGLRSETLGTEELIELFFKIFNPGESDAPHSASAKVAGTTDQTTNQQDDQNN